jgi:hypothetical protein
MPELPWHSTDDSMRAVCAMALAGPLWIFLKKSMNLLHPLCYSWLPPTTAASRILEVPTLTLHYCLGVASYSLLLP